jgi:4-amino-4-deoxy-L-arabinose transferase-like glycosyltransferase
LPAAVWVIATLAFVNGAAWALLTLPWQGPDEIQHFAYVQHLATAGNVDSRSGPMGRTFSTEHQYAMEASLTDSVRSNPRGRPPWGQESRVAWKARNKQLHGSPSDGGAATGYTPEYYAVAAAGYLAFDWGDIFERQFGTRLISALLGALTAIFVWLFAREVFRREGWLPNTAALSVVLLPQFGFISGIVNNDSLAILLGSVELYLLARALRRGLTPKLSVLIGVVLALAYLAKPSLSAFGPVVAGVLAWPLIRGRDRRQLLLPVAGLAGFVLVALLWTGVAAIADRGLTTVSTVNSRTFSLGDFVSYLWHFYLPSLPGTTDKWFGSQAPIYSVWMHGFFATFGSTDTQFAAPVYKVLTAICIGALAMLGVAFWRERAAVRSALPTILMAAAAVLALVLFVHLTFYLFYAGYPGEQGRYLLPLAPIFGAAVAASTLALGRRWAPALAAFYVTALGCFTVFSYGLVITRYFT